MKDITVTLRCNWCAGEIGTFGSDATDEALADNEIVVTFGDQAGRIDLCDECRIQWRDDIAVLLVNAAPLEKPKLVAGGKGGKRTKKVAAVEGTVPCPHCDFNAKNVNGLAVHAFRKHGIKGEFAK